MIEHRKRAASKKRIFFAAFLVPILFSAAVYFEYRPELAAAWSAIKSEDSHPAVLTRTIPWRGKRCGWTSMC